MLKFQNIPLFLSLFRLLAIFPLYVLIWHPPFQSHWTAMIFFIIVAITDSLDGYLARKWNCSTFLGGIMDSVADKVLVIGALMLLVSLGRVLMIIAFLFLVREFLITGARIFAAKNNVSLKPKRLGKWKTGFEMTGVSMLILYNPSSFFYIPIHIIGHTVLLIGLALAWLSGFQYLKKFMKTPS